jgi:hypothetical protein
VASDELGDVGEPDLVESRPLEVGKRELKDPESLLEVETVPEELCVLEQHERRETAVFLASFEGSLDLAEVAEVDLKIDVELPERGVAA